MISRVGMIALIRRVRDICLRRYPGDIDPLSDKERAERLGLEVNDTPQNRLRIEHDAMPIEEICQLAKTPRLLKLILRNTYRSWDELHGELDFDDILVANVLRFAAPEAFEFLLEHKGEIRGLIMDGIRKNRDARFNAIEEKWSTATQTVSWDTVSAKSMAQFLFPAWQNRGGGKPPTPQGVQVSYPADYWARLLVGELDDQEIHDQEVLRAIQGWKNNPDGAHFRGKALSEILGTDEAFANLFEHFARLLLDGKDFRNLAAQLFAKALETQGPSANKDSVPGFISLWRLSLKQPLEESDHIQWVQEEISKALPISLHLANDIYYYWRSNSDQDVEFKKRYPAIRTAMVDRAKELFSGKPNALISAIDPNFMYSSFHFCFIFSSEAEGGASFLPSDWEWFSELLVTAAEINSQLMIPQIACFIVKEEMGVHEFHYTYDEKGVADLFGKQIARLMKTLSKEIFLDGYNARETKRFLVLRETTQKWLKEHPSEG